MGISVGKVIEFLTYLTVENTSVIYGAYTSYAEIYSLFYEAKVSGALEKIGSNYVYSATGMGDYFELTLMTGRTIRVEHVLNQEKDFTVVFT